ncbi:hypothetical protein KSP40_PGU009019 [Platanthera guangdongensis]|uniref:AAA+ ATPase domain-containing protein n=1 Tax=Platanthera guangdongensis TaxID=2320717 RepID=A0ABR2M6E3_9ASPA
MDSQSKAIESAKKYLAAATSVAATAMLTRTIISAYFPDELRRLISSSLDKLVGHFYGEHVVIIRQNEGLVTNDLYDAATTYLRTKISPTSKRLRASKNRNRTNIIISLDDGECLTDIFEGVQYKWQLVSQRERSNPLYAGSSHVEEIRWLALSFHRKYREVAVASYFPHILERSKEIKAADRQLKLYMNELGNWNCVHLQHPATSETLAMEVELKKSIFDDLARFVNRKEYYKRIGKAWKRGYLLFGPPGTGKSSLIAAMANYLRFDIYDLDLNGINGNTDLKRMLIGMANKSILVIEDIDCSINVQNRDDDGSETETEPGGKAVTLSGILNLIDGLWSANGEERIIVLTTNYRDRLDPALLRPGRMDMHIHMGYCGPNGFRMLASNYHGVDEHPLFAEIEGLLKEVEATPAEVAEELMRSDDAGIALGSLILFLRDKRRVGGEEDKGRGEEGGLALQLESEKIDREEKKVGSEVTGGRKRKSRK